MATPSSPFWLRPLFAALVVACVLGCESSPPSQAEVNAPADNPTDPAVDPTPAQPPVLEAPKQRQLLVHTGHFAKPNGPAEKVLVVLEGAPRLAQWVDVNGDVAFDGDHSGPKTVTVAFAKPGTDADGKAVTFYRVTTLVDVPGEELWFERTYENLGPSSLRGTIQGTVSPLPANPIDVSVAVVSRHFIGYGSPTATGAFSIPVEGYSEGAVDLFASERDIDAGAKRIGMVKDVPVKGPGTQTNQDITLTHAVDKPLTVQKVENSELYENPAAGDRRVQAYLYFTRHNKTLFWQKRQALAPLQFLRPDYTAPFDDLGVRVVLFTGQSYLPAGQAVAEFRRGPTEDATFSLLRPSNIVAPALGKFNAPPQVRTDPLQVSWNVDPRATYVESFVMDHMPSEFLGDPKFLWRVVMPASRQSMALPPIPPEVYGSSTLKPGRWIFALKAGVFQHWPTGFELYNRQDTGEPGDQSVTIKDGFFEVK